jgi:hypothetical protein
LTGCSYQGTDEPPVGDCAGKVCDGLGVGATLEVGATDDEDVDATTLDVVGTGALEDVAAAAPNTTFTTPPPQYRPDLSPVTWYDAGPGTSFVVTWEPVNGTGAVVQLATSWSAPDVAQRKVMSSPTAGCSFDALKSTLHVGGGAAGAAEATPESPNSAPAAVAANAAL